MDFGAVLRQTPMAGFRQKTKMRTAAVSYANSLVRSSDSAKPFRYRVFLGIDTVFSQKEYTIQPISFCARAS